MGGRRPTSVATTGAAVALGYLGFEAGLGSGAFLGLVLTQPGANLLKPWAAPVWFTCWRTLSGIHNPAKGILPWRQKISAGDHPFWIRAGYIRWNRNSAALDVLAGRRLVFSGRFGFGSVLLHEFGHCFAARSVGGRADAIVLWPLGGVAYTQANRGNVLHSVCISLAGPLVNFLIGAGCALALWARGYVFHWVDFSPLEFEASGGLSEVGIVL